MNPQIPIIYVDVDDTLVRSIGTKRIPMSSVIARVRELKDQGAIMYCWSTGGGEYARESAIELGVFECFVGFLPKPRWIIDDQEPAKWRGFECIHPSNC